MVNKDKYSKSPQLDPRRLGLSTRCIGLGYLLMPLFHTCTFCFPCQFSLNAYLCLECLIVLPVLISLNLNQILGESFHYTDILTRSSAIVHVGGHYAVQGHSRSSISMAIVSLCVILIRE